MNDSDTTDAPTRRSDPVHCIENGTAALTDLGGDGMVRAIARRLGRTVAPQAQGTPIRGVLAITVGIAAISFPAVALPTMLVILGGYFLVDGVLCMLGLWGAVGHRWRLAVPGALSICAAGLIFTQPELSQIGLVVLLSVWVIAMGAFRLRECQQSSRLRIPPCGRKAICTCVEVAAVAGDRAVSGGAGPAREVRHDDASSAGLPLYGSWPASATY